MKQYIEITTTFKNREDAECFVKGILDAKLVACVQMSEIMSWYSFEEKNCSHKEYRLAMTTCSSLFEKCEEFIKKHHPYKLPQIVAKKIEYISVEYSDWADGQI
ncbi:MAG: divalent-cation tolerance protein CutA [Firmicutes bacterium]|nr:divalent-cation tolerance protein CutA [Bacillota bacterium]